MATNKELLAQAVTAIPLWRAFLDKKEAEQDALLAEVRAELSEESADTAENILTDKAPLAENTDFEAQTPVSEKQPPHEESEKVAQAQPVEPKHLMSWLRKISQMSRHASLTLRRMRTTIVTNSKTFSAKEEILTSVSTSQIMGIIQRKITVCRNSTYHHCRLSSNCRFRWTGPHRDSRYRQIR